MTMPEAQPGPVELAAELAEIRARLEAIETMMGAAIAAAPVWLRIRMKGARDGQDRGPGPGRRGAAQPVRRVD